MINFKKFSKIVNLISVKYEFFSITGKISFTFFLIFTFKILKILAKIYFLHKLSVDFKKKIISKFFKNILKKKEKKIPKFIKKKIFLKKNIKKKIIPKFLNLFFCVILITYHFFFFQTIT